MRKLFGFTALLAALGALAVSNSTAAEQTPPASEQGTPPSAQPVTPGPTPASIGQCQVGWYCAWSGNNFTGNFSAWATAGCQNHVNNPNIRSGYNHGTGAGAQYGGQVYLFNNSSFSQTPSGNPITGLICWPR